MLFDDDGDRRATLERHASRTELETEAPDLNNAVDVASGGLDADAALFAPKQATTSPSDDAPDDERGQWPGSSSFRSRSEAGG